MDGHDSLELDSLQLTKALLDNGLCLSDLEKVSNSSVLSKKVANFIKKILPQKTLIK